MVCGSVQSVVAVSEASASRRIQSVRMGAPGSPADIARPLTIAVFGEDRLLCNRHCH